MNWTGEVRANADPSVFELGHGGGGGVTWVDDLPESAAVLSIDDVHSRLAAAPAASVPGSTTVAGCGSGGGALVAAIGAVGRGRRRIRRPLPPVHNRRRSGDAEGDGDADQRWADAG